jgi:hypothetical protein
MEEEEEEEEEQRIIDKNVTNDTIPTTSYPEAKKSQCLVSDSVLLLLNRKPRLLLFFRDRYAVDMSHIHLSSLYAIAKKMAGYVGVL